MSIQVIDMPQLILTVPRFNAVNIASTLSTEPAWPLPGDRLEKGWALLWPWTYVLATAGYPSVLSPVFSGPDCDLRLYYTVSKTDVNWLPIDGSTGKFYDFDTSMIYKEMLIVPGAKVACGVYLGIFTADGDGALDATFTCTIYGYEKSVI